MARHEKKGIDRKLYDMMLDWYFSKQNNVWLGTAPGTRAELFYQKSGWRKAGMHGRETQFEMTAEESKSIKDARKPRYFDNMLADVSKVP